MFGQVAIFCILVLQIKCYIKVLSPEGLIEKYGLNYQIQIQYGNFGFIPYGYQLNDEIKLVSDRHGNVLDTVCPDSRLERSNLTNQQKVIISRRSNAKRCTIPDQAQFFEDHGFQIAVIIDNLDEDLENLEVEDESKSHLYTLRIPVIIVAKADGEKILSALREYPSIELLIYFEPPIQREVPSIEYWYELMSPRSYDFFRNFKDNYYSLEEYIDFKQQFQFHSCIGCVYIMEDTTCLSSGRYCLNNVVTRSGKTVTGRAQLEEIIRAKCLQESFGNIQWWDYQICFSNHCLNTENLEECSKNCQDSLNLDQKITEKCFSSSFLEFAPQSEEEVINSVRFDNRILQQYAANENQTQVTTWPSLIVNNFKFKGNLETFIGPYEFICKAFLESRQPDFCRKFWAGYQPAEKVDPYGYFVHHNRPYLLVFMLLVSIGALLFFFIYRKKIGTQKQKPAQTSQYSSYIVLQERNRSREDNQV